MKKLKFINDSDINELSPFAKFHIALNGYRLEVNGNPVDKWEVWALGFKNAENILSGLTDIKAIKGTWS